MNAVSTTLRHKVSFLWQQQLRLSNQSREDAVDACSESPPWAVKSPSPIHHLPPKPLSAHNTRCCFDDLDHGQRIRFVHQEFQHCRWYVRNVFFNLSHISLSRMAAVSGCCYVLQDNVRIEIWSQAARQQFFIAFLSHDLLKTWCGFGETIRQKEAWSGAARGGMVWDGIACGGTADNRHCFSHWGSIAAVSVIFFVNTFRRFAIFDVFCHEHHQQDMVH